MKIARMVDGYYRSVDESSWQKLRDTPADTPIRHLLDRLPDLDQESGEPTRQIANESLLCPVVEPSKIVAVGLNYLSHLKELGIEAPKNPNLFAKFPNSLNDPYGPIARPSATSALDYEVELALVISRDGRNISPEDAKSHIFGFCVANDVSARDIQTADVQVCRAKSFDTFCPLGPVIVSTEAIGDYSNLEIRTFVNGELRQSSNTRDLLFSVDEIVAFASTDTTLRKGDVLLTGTPGGVGFRRTPPLFLNPGDVVECEIESIGSIRNTVVAA